MQLQAGCRRLVGTKSFYKMVLMISVPIMLQNGITNFVSMLDNIMVGQVGTNPMSGVAIVNQLLFVFNICVFGAVSGAGIFGAQFFGCGDRQGQQYAFRYKIWICSIILAASLLIFGFWGSDLASLYLNDDGSAADVAATLRYAQDYLRVMMIGLPPYVLTQVYASSLRETGQTLEPMKASLLAVVVNLCLNYVLIFGKFGAPALGVVGAAIATVISRFMECIYIVVWMHCHKEKSPYIIGIYRSLRIPRKLVFEIIVKGTPLLLNEMLWASGMAVLSQCYSLRGLAVVAAVNITSTIFNVISVVYIALGDSVAIMVGRQLGANQFDEAKDTAYKLIAFAVFSCVLTGALMGVLGPIFPKLYDTTEEIRSLACGMIWINAACMPIFGFLHACYFTMRSGGKTIITFIFDSGYLWVIMVPLAIFLSRYTSAAILPLYFATKFIEAGKCILGTVLVARGTWINNMVSK